MNRPLTTSVLAALLLGACDAAPAAPTCATTGMGDLTVNISGLPVGVNGHVTVVGPAGTFVVASTITLSGVSAGTYDLIPRNRATSDSIVSRMYGVAGGARAVCVSAGLTRTTQMTYAPIASAGKVWVGAGGSSLGFTTEQLVATATLAPAVSAFTRGSVGATFDRDGNLWVRGAGPADPHLMRFAASTLGSTGTPTPDRNINIPGLTCEGSSALAFDESGDLWVSLGCVGAVVRLEESQLTQSGSATPQVVLSNMERPDGIAFDGAGNLWVADDHQLRRYDASRLGASTSTPSDLTVTIDRPVAPSPNDMQLNVNHLAFDAAGALWGGSYGQNAFFKFDLASIPATGSQRTTPSPIIYIGSFAQPRGFAFDNGGGLLVAHNSTTFARLSPAQLTVTTIPSQPITPARVFASSSILGYAENVVLFPAPAGTPLYHRAR